MMSQYPLSAPPEFEDDTAHIAMIARKATRKAARAANRAGYFVEHALGACVVKSPNHAVKVPLKTSTIDVNKQYVFADEKH